MRVLTPVFFPYTKKNQQNCTSKNSPLPEQKDLLFPGVHGMMRGRGMVTARTQRIAPCTRKKEYYFHIFGRAKERLGSKLKEGDAFCALPSLATFRECRGELGSSLIVQLRFTENTASLKIFTHDVPSGHHVFKIRLSILFFVAVVVFFFSSS